MSQITCIAVSVWQGMAIAAVALAVCYVIAVAIAIERRRLRRARRDHLTSHPAISDDAFLREIGIPSEQSFIALRVREAVAGLLKVPATTIHASDTIRHVTEFQFDGMDWLDLVYRFDKALMVRFPKHELPRYLFTDRVGWEHAESITVAEIARRLAANWAEISRLSDTNRKRT